MGFAAIISIILVIVALLYLISNIIILIAVNVDDELKCSLIRRTVNRFKRGNVIGKIIMCFAVVYEIPALILDAIIGGCVSICDVIRAIGEFIDERFFSAEE